MKGFIVFYLNHQPDSPLTVDQHIEFVKKHNKELVELLRQEGYNVMYVPTVKEACRVEKVDLDLPYPRYVAPHIDIVENDKIMENMAKAVQEGSQD